MMTKITKQKKKKAHKFDALSTWILFLYVYAVYEWLFQSPSWNPLYEVIRKMNESTNTCIFGVYKVSQNILKRM